MKINIEYTEREILDLLKKDISAKLDLDEFEEKNLHIMIKSKQNYKSEWEIANFKATYEHFKA